MADNNEKQTLKLDLDAGEFIEKVLKAKEGIEGLGDKENLTGLIEGLTNVASVIGIVGTALFVLKQSFDAVLDAEKIQKINNQFEMLAHQSGIVAENLKEGLIGASKGLADDTDILQAANKALVSMGDNARRLPEIMELARKSTNVFGGDLVQNFENMTQALAAGNTRALKHMGIIVDLEKAQIAYAKSIGVTVSDLTEQEKKTAILEEALKKGAQQFKNVKENTESLTIVWKQLKVQAEDLRETLVLAFERTVGPSLRSFFKEAAESFKGWAALIKSTFGTDVQQAEGNVTLLKIKIKELDESMKQMESGGPWFARFFGGEEANKVVLESMKKQREEMEAQLKLAEEAEKTAREKKGVQGTEQFGPSEEGLARADEMRSKEREHALKFHEETLKLQQQNLEKEIEQSMNAEEIKEARKEQIALIDEQRNAQLAMIDQQFKKGEIANVEEAEARKLEIQEAAAHEKMAILRKSQEDEIRAIQNTEKYGETASQRFGAGFKKASVEAAQSVQNFSKIGEKSFQILHRRASDAFIAMGEGAESGADIMKGFMLNSIADIAQAQGEEMLAAALVNPAYAAAGAGLLVLSGAIRAAAGGLGKSSMGGTSFGGGDYGGVGSQSSFADQGAVNQLQPEVQPKKTVHINVMGHYFETEQTKMALLQMIRENSDATDFIYNQISPGVGR